MTEFENWVAQEAENMGYNFHELPKEKQNFILSNILAGIENGFRSRCNYPDIRFGRRKSILKKGNSGNIENTQSINLQPQYVVNTYGPDCSDSAACYEGLCINEANQGCIDTNDCNDCSCGNNAGPPAADCTDSIKCLDGSCINANCEDAGSSEVNRCSDYQCINSGTLSGGDTCQDGNCSDSPCVNMPAGASACSTDTDCKNDPCINSSGCSGPNDPSDIRCTNQPYCSDTGCLDSNFHCTDINGCVDSGVTCTNNTQHVCADGTTQTSCGDQSCFNSTNCVDDSVGGCRDFSCENQPGGTCIDKDTCKDETCKNTGFCIDDHMCNDVSCRNEGTCIDLNTCQDNGGPSCGSDFGYCPPDMNLDNCTNRICLPI